MFHLANYSRGTGVVLYIFSLYTNLVVLPKSGLLAQHTFEYQIWRSYANFTAAQAGTRLLARRVGDLFNCPRAPLGFVTISKSCRIFGYNLPLQPPAWVCCFFFSLSETSLAMMMMLVIRLLYIGPLSTLLSHAHFKIE